MTDFTGVLLTDKVAWQLFGLADREHVLYTSGEGENPPIPQRGAISQRTLSFLVLFDEGEVAALNARWREGKNGNADSTG
jgi:hypothetical protein